MASAAVMAKKNTVDKCSIPKAFGPLSRNGLKLEVNNKVANQTKTKITSSYIPSPVELANTRSLQSVTEEEIQRRMDRKKRFFSDHNKKSKSQKKTKLKKVNPLYCPLTGKKNGLQGEGAESFSSTASNSSSSSHDRLVGENQNLEKPYLRLTTFPRKEDVRPLEVLVKSLAHIKNRYIRDEDFAWANEQLKSVRQDLTVQGIRNVFVLNVYEIHARILLEHGDLNEFNQCQTMIHSLTSRCGSVANQRKSSSKLETSNTNPLDVNEESQPSDVDEDQKDLEDLGYSQDSGDRFPPLCQTEEARDEFLGYGLLYSLVRESWLELKKELARASLSVETTNSAHIRQGQYKYDGGREKVSDKNRGNRDTDDGNERESCVAHALQVIRAVGTSRPEDEVDYRAFFRLYESAPHMSAYLMDFLVKRVRDAAYDRITVSYRPNVSAEEFREQLRFEDLEETRCFLRQRGAVFVQEPGMASSPPFWVDCKASTHQGRHSPSFE